MPDDLPAVQADPGLLERVMANLVGKRDAVQPRRSTPPSSPAARLGERVELRVMDRGPGIPAADLDQVFTPFQRLGDTDNTTGVGLGLALSRGLTEAMGGSLDAGGDPGRWADHGACRCPIRTGYPDIRSDAEPGHRERDRTILRSATKGAP